MKRRGTTVKEVEQDLRPRFDLTDLYPLVGLIGLASYFILG